MENFETEQIILICKSVWYYSTIDETLFFDWIKKIPSIIKYDGRYDELYLYINDTNINDADLQELLALFYRYKIKNMKQLAIFLTDQNKHWFYEEPKSYWHKKVFGSNS